MWLVRIALTRPYTFIVLAILLLIFGPFTILRTPTDIFPDINIPVVSVVWNYTGLSPDEMGTRIVANFERAATTTVNDIEHLESQSLNGIGVIKVFFQPSVKVDMALSQITAIAQTLLRALPPGTTPPLILSYNASTVPVMQLVLSSKRLSEQELNDLGTNFIRTQLATIQGAALPFPYGGKTRQIQVDLNQEAMQTYGISPTDITNAINNQNLILPAGTEKIGVYEYYVKLNSSPEIVTELNELPIRSANNSILYIRDVAHVRDGFAPQTNIVRFNGARAVLMSIQKTGNASTLDITNRLKELLPSIKESMPEALHINLFADQSLFVLAAIHGVIHEGVLAAILTALMILLFLGSLRSTFIIVISIPLSILASLIMLSALGETINIMTLGGLALAVGILVDDATVAIENINWNLEQGKDVYTAIMDGAEQIAIPALVSTLCICIVFVPMFLLTGVARFLFVPMAEAVIFAMLASYFLSRTLVPTLALYWLKKHEEKPTAETVASSNKLVQIQHAFETSFEKLRDHYRSLLEKVLQNSKVFLVGFISFLFLSLIIFLPWIGSDFFPNVDAGQIKMHLRAPIGTRIEETARIIDLVDNLIRKIIPESDLDSIVDNIGLPRSGINISYSNSGTIGPEDSDVLISLKEGHKPTDDYVHEIRKQLRRAMPEVTFAFLPADIVGQILNFGLPAPINIQVMGFKLDENLHYTRVLLEKIKHIPGIADARIQQAYNYPELYLDVDRSLASDLGFTQADIASNTLISLSGTSQVAPNFWLSPEGVSYSVVVQTPEYNMDSLQKLLNIPMTKVGVAPQILGSMATVSRRGVSAIETHYNVQPVIEIFASVQDRDLGGVGKAVNAAIKSTSDILPKGSKVVVRGQMETQRSSFNGLFAGLGFAIVLIYLLIVVNFQSWIDPFIIITALPAAIVGIIWILFFTNTTLSVPALTGAIMCMGVATANSILVINFALTDMKEGRTPMEAAINAGFTRLRPVMMTALAMIIGMLPMAFSMGEGGEQNAPLGRAVIGGLLFATIATLFFVPTVFTLIHENLRKRAVHKGIPS